MRKEAESKKSLHPNSHLRPTEAKLALPRLLLEGELETDEHTEPPHIRVLVLVEVSEPVN